MGHRSFKIELTGRSRKNMRGKSRLSDWDGMTRSFRRVTNRPWGHSLQLWPVTGSEIEISVSSRLFHQVGIWHCGIIANLRPRWRMPWDFVDFTRISQHPKYRNQKRPRLRSRPNLRIGSIFDMDQPKRRSMKVGFMPEFKHSHQFATSIV